MKYVISDETQTVIAIHDNNQDVENLYPNCTVYQSTQIYQLGAAFVIPPATVQDLTEFLYQQKCKVAYGGVSVVKNGETYTFETTQDSITMCNSLSLAIATQSDDYVISWKCWSEGVPKMLELTKAQFNQIFAFGIQMINEAFAVQGILNATVQGMNAQQLADKEYIAQFKQQTADAFSAVNTVLDISQLSDSATQVSDSMSEGTEIPEGE